LIVTTLRGPVKMQQKHPCPNPSFAIEYPPNNESLTGHREK